LDLLMLPDTDAVQLFRTVKQSLEPIESAVVTITKFFTGEGIYKTVGIKTTDDAGKFTEYLELDAQYRFYVVKGGVSLGVVDKTSICEAAPCTLTLEIGVDSIDILEGIEAVYGFNILSNLTYDSVGRLITYNFLDTTGLATYFQMITRKSAMNQTGDVICDDTVFSTAGSITCNITTYQGDWIATTYVSRSPALIDLILRGSGRDLYSAIGADMGLFVTVFLIMTLALVGVWNPAVAVGFAMAGVVFGRMMGFAGYSMVTVVTVLILGGIIIYKMKV